MNLSDLHISPPIISQTLVMLTSRDAWNIIEQHAPRDEWLKVRQIYGIVERHATLDEVDTQGIADSGTSTRWQRTIRNALQRQKQAGGVEFARGHGYRLAPTAGSRGGS